MAETFPVGFSRIDINPPSGWSYSRETGGLLVSSRGGRNAIWQGTLTTGKLTRSEWADLYGAIWNAIERNLRFDFVHPTFRLPRAYTDDTWPLVGVPTIEAVTDGYTLSMAGLEVGMTLKRGDRFCIFQDELRGYRMVATDTVVESTTAQAIPLAPRLPIGVFAPAAAVHFVDPPMRLAVVEEGFSMPRDYQPTSVTIGVQESLA